MHSNIAFMSTVLGLQLKKSQAKLIFSGVKNLSFRSSPVIKLTGTSNESAFFRSANNLIRSTSFSYRMLMKATISFGNLKKLITCNFEAKD